jgi:cell wall-associated NlpC family hydrolase
MTGPLRVTAAALAAGVTAVALLAAAGLQALAAPELTPTAVATSSIPVDYLRLYRAAAAVCPMPWPILAAVGAVESDHGRDTAASSAGAVGPMQFLPSTWRAYGVDADGDGRADPRNPADAIPTAANYLCALHVAADPHDALVAFNCGDTGPACQAASAGYAATVHGLAARYATATTGTSPVAALAVQAALAQLGTPYLWGGESPGGFDCSGLVQWSYARAGLLLPRTAQQQYDATVHLSAGAPLQPGDLLFYGTSPRAVDHVVIALGDGRVVEAPHTGALVRIEVADTVSATYLGATRPTGGTA